LSRWHVVAAKSKHLGGMESIGAKAAVSWAWKSRGLYAFSGGKNTFIGEVRRVKKL